MVQPRKMLPGEEIWSELEPRLQAIHSSLEPLVVAQSQLGPADGGPPLARIVAYAATKPAPHWHFVTCGLSASRFVPGYPSVGDIELSFRLGRAKNEKTPPAWVANFLQQLGRDAFSDDKPVQIEKPVELETFWQRAHDTALVAGLYIEDPDVDSGPIRLIQLVALTAAERQRVTSGSSNRAKILLELAPSGISDLARVRRPPPPAPAAARAPPPPPFQPKLSTVSVAKSGTRMRLTIEPAEVAALIEAITASIRERVSFISQGWTVHLSVEDLARSATWATTLAIYFPLELSKQISAELADPLRRGTPLTWGPLPDLELFVIGTPQPKESVFKKIGNFFGMP